MHSKRHPVRGAISKSKIWWNKNRLSPNVASSENVSSKCAVRDKCGGASEMMEMWVKQCGVEMWRQTLMWRQSEMWRQNVAANTPCTKLSSRKCVFKTGIQWQAQKCYTKCRFDLSVIFLKVAILMAHVGKKMGESLVPYFTCHAATFEGDVEKTCFSQCYATIAERKNAMFGSWLPCC